MDKATVSAELRARLKAQHAKAERYGETWVKRLQPEFAHLPKGTVVVINCRTGQYVTGATLLKAADEFERRFKEDVGYAHEIGGGFFVGGELSEIVGHVDERHRAIVSLSLPGQEDGFPVIVDTGFNGQLLINDTEIARLKCENMGIEVPVEFANREHRMLSLARSRIVWFDRLRDVHVWITTAELARPVARDEPLGLLGTALLNPHKLTVDFATRRVVIGKIEE